MSTDDAPKQQSDASDEMTEKASDGEAALHNKSDASVSAQAFPLAGISPRDLRKLVPPDVIQAAISEVQEPASAPVQIVEHSEYYVGPLPTAQMLADYDDVVPGCAEAIVENFTSEGKHRRARENRGQHYALVSLLMILATALACVFLGEPFAGGMIGIAGLGGLFITSRVVGITRVSAGD